MAAYIRSLLVYVCCIVWQQSTAKQCNTHTPKHTNADAFSTLPCPDDCSHCRKIEQRADSPKVRIVAAAIPIEWDRQALRREQLADDDVEPLLREMKAGQRPEWRGMNDRCPI